MGQVDLDANKNEVDSNVNEVETMTEEPEHNQSAEDCKSEEQKSVKNIAQENETARFDWIEKQLLTKSGIAEVKKFKINMKHALRETTQNLTIATKQLGDLEKDVNELKKQNLKMLNDGKNTKVHGVIISA